MVLNRLPGLYGLKYESGTARRLALYLCSYKLDGSVTACAARLCEASLMMKEDLIGYARYCIPYKHISCKPIRIDSTDL